MISVEKLTKTHGQGDSEFVALHEVDFSVEAGEIFAVVGPSGAGKSTLAHCINLLTLPTSGSIVVDGRDLTRLGARDLRAARRAIGTVFQSSALLSRRTAAGNISLPLEYLGVAKKAREERVAELLERVGLTDRANHLPHQLSGGQRQRVGIARALALRPSVLLSDEATSGLDPQTTTSVLALLRELRDDLGLTILMITHEMAVVREVADRVALLEAGRIVEQGRVVELVTDPSSQLGRALLPRPPIGITEEGQDIWQVTFNDTDVPGDWIERAAADLGTQVSLLAASIEPINGVLTGHATLGVKAGYPGDRLALSFASLGLFAEPVSVSADREPTGEIPALVAA